MTYVLEDWVGTNGWELWGLGGPSAITLTRCSSEKSGLSLETHQQVGKMASG